MATLRNEGRLHQTRFMVAGKRAREYRSLRSRLGKQLICATKIGGAK
jgi:hypothetical protein